MRPVPLDGMRTFEAAARLGSLAAAARELNLTESAVSHQLRRLREALGFDLFVRQGRGVRLSSAGASLLKALQPALGSIDEAALRLRRSDGGSGRLSIACSSMFANRVLASRIGAFAEQHPQIECHVRSMENDQALLAADADVAILFGPGGWPGKWESRLASVRYSPVCSPKLFAGQRLPRQPAELLEHTILHIDEGSEWRRWLDLAGVAAERRIGRQILTNDVSVALEVARQGGGITLASEIMAAPDLATGGLVRPFAQAIDVAGGWYMVAGRDRARLLRVQIFAAWLARGLGLAAPSFA